MKSLLKKTTAKVAVFAMLLSVVPVSIPAKESKAAELSPYLNVEYGIQYTGERTAQANADGTAWSIEYFNVANSAYETGDEFYISTKVSGAENFKQVAIQSSVNGWDWAAAPKKWSGDGTANDTVIAGKVTATQDGDNLAFKIQFDNAIDTVEEDPTITLTDLYIMKLGDASDAEALPTDKQIALGTEYTGTVEAVLNDNVYEAQYFNVTDSSYSAGDTYIISYTLGGATGFKQVATQSNLDGWSWNGATKVWANDGLAEAQNVAGSFTSSSAGNGVSFKIRLDTPVDADAEWADSIDITLTNLVVVKVSNDDTVTLPSSMELNKNRKYSGKINAEKGEGSWNIQYFNVNDSAMKKDDQFKITFSISGASAFKQLVVQTNANNWAWDVAPKTWQSEGIADGTSFSAIITATQAIQNIAFKLWLDNPVDESFDTTPVEITLKDLQISDVATVASLNKAYKDYFNVGAAVSASMAGDVDYQNRITGTFGTITAENEMKPDALLNQSASQNGDGTPVLNLEYSGMTKILDFAKANGLEVRGHALVYAAQTSDWFFREGYTDDGDYVDADTMDARLQSYIEQVVTFVDTNYPGVVTAWDVVNEAFDDDGSFKENGWTETLGEDYVAKAFEYAREATDSKLFYNDYNLELAAKQDAIMNNLVYMDVDFDGVGMQEHVTLTYPTINAIQNAIEFFATEIGEVQITELDVQIEANETEEAQAERYAALFNLFKDNSSALTNVTVWGINDGNSWRSDKRPLLFYDDLTPKPAFQSVLDAAK